MTADDIDIEALLDAPLKAATKPAQSVDDVIGAAKHESSHRDHRRDRRDSRDRDHRRDDRDYRDHREHREHKDYRDRKDYRDYEDERHSRDHYRDRRDYHDDRRDRRRYSPEPTRSRGITSEHVSAPKMPLTEAERDRRTVFCRQLAQRVRSEDLRTFCTQAGPVHDVRIVYDRISNRSKGVAYVEFAEAVSVQKAIGLTGQKLCGIPIIIELTETEKNRLAEEAAEAAKRNKPVTATNGTVGVVSFSRITKVFVGGLHPSLDEAALRKVFEPFGDVELVEIPRGPANEPNGTAHIQNASDAGMAVDQMNGFTLAGRPIRVGILRDRPDGTNAVQYKAGEVFSSNLDDAETQGLSLNAKTRTELMMKLARDPLPIPGRPAGPSPCILLSGMYDPDEESELGWEYAITDEVRDECTRFGPITHISVAKNKDGQVWIKFASTQSAQSAINELNGRWFGGRQIQAVFVDQNEYHRRFAMQLPYP